MICTTLSPELGSDYFFKTALLLAGVCPIRSPPATCECLVRFEDKCPVSPASHMT